MKTRKLTAGLFSQEQPAPLETRMLPEIQAQAKQGAISAVSGADAGITSLGAASLPTNTLAGVMRDAFGVAAQEKIGVINLANRQVTILPAGTGLGAVIGATDGKVATFVKDDPTKASSPFHDTAAAAGVDAAPLLLIVDEVKPAFSVESLCNKIEDTFAGVPALEGRSALIVVDQANGTVDVYSGLTADINVILPQADLPEDATFQQTLQSATGVQFGE